MENKNCPAFPIDGTHLNEGYNIKYGGLTKREHFAVMAMQGLLSNNSRRFDNHDDIVKAAVEYADNILTELDKD